jgi:hypothetical protein
MNLELLGSENHKENQLLLIYKKILGNKSTLSLLKKHLKTVMYFAVDSIKEVHYLEQVV